jgi:hypothetical protein
MAKIIEKTVSDRTFVMAVHEIVHYPFAASGWTDLRAGFFVSLTKALSDDDPTGLAETLTPADSIQPQGRYWMGLKKFGSYWPTDPNTVFVGFSNRAGSDPDAGASVLSSSDIGLGTTNAYYWRPNNAYLSDSSALMLDGRLVRARSPDGVQQHLPQDPTGAGGYSVLLALRLLRDTPSSNVLTLKIKSSGQSADMLYSNTPSSDLLLSGLQSWPSNTIQMGPVQMSQVPDSFFFFWPFLNSRLRIHVIGVLKAK